MDQEVGGTKDSDVNRIIRGLPGAVVLLSSDEFRVKYVNEAYRHFLPRRFRDKDLTGVRLVEFVAGGEKSPVLDILRRVSETREGSERMEFQIRNEDGVEFWMEWSALPIDNGTDRPDLLVMIMDITGSKQSRRLSEALNQASSYINSTLDYGEIMQRVLKQDAKALDAESSLINIREADHWVARFVHDFPSSIVGQKKTDAESPTSMMAVRKGRAVAIDDAPNDPRVDREAMKRFGVRSVLVAPILLRDAVIGVIAFYYHSRSVRFSDAQIDFANRLAGSLSQAIDNSRNYQGAKNAEERVRRQNMILEGINRIFHESIVTETSEELGLVCLGVIERVTQSKFGFIGQLNSNGYLDDDAISDPGWEACQIQAPVGHGRLPTSMRVTGLYGRVITSGAGFFSNDPSSHPDSTGVPPGHPPLTAFMGVPLKHAGKVIGMVGLGNKEGGYSEEDLQAAEVIAPAIVEALKRKKAEEDLQASEAKYRSLFESIQQSITLMQLVFDADGRVVDRILIDANPASLRSLGVRTIDEVRGKKDSEMLSPASRAWALDHMNRMRSAGGPITEEENLDSNGRDYMTTSVPLGTDYVITTRVDITESRETQRLLEENYEAERQRAEEVERLMDIIPSAVWVAHDPECRMITGNRVADQFYESDPGENVSAGPVTGDMHDRTRRFFSDGRELRPEELPMQQAATKGLEIRDTELEVLTPSGKRLTILGSASPLLNSRKEVRGCIASFVDITQRKNQERELEETKGRLEAIIGQMPVGIIVTEAGTGKVLFANQEIQKIYGLGFSLTDIKGFDEYNRLARHHVDGEPYQTDEYPFVRSLNGEVVRNDLSEIVRSDGSKVYISSSSAPVYDFRGAIVASVALSIDVTMQVRTQRERDRLLAELEEHSRKLQRSNAELQQFAYVASHDLQEPLRMVTAYLSLLEKRYGDRLDGKAREYMDYAIEGGLRAKYLVRDLLEISRIESQAKPMTLTDMNQVMDTVISNLSVQIAEEEATVSHDWMPTVIADEAQMTILLQNLISNGIKFHGDWNPRVHVSYENQGDRWLFAVKDNGIGIDPQFKDKIFVIFQRLHSRDEYEGTGIGLAIAKKIVERHGGRIWFESFAGEGTTFFFTISKGGRQ